MLQQCCDRDLHEHMEELATLPKHMQPVDMNKPAAQTHAVDHGTLGIDHGTWAPDAVA